jgi:ABC-type transport system substrate-binding protein
VDGTLTYVRGADSVKLDAAAVTDGESSKVVEQIYDNLVRFKAHTTEIEPALATSWEVGADKLAWTFRIREGVAFHDGTTVDAAAVVNAFERQRDKTHKHHFPTHQYAYYHDLLEPFVQRVELGAAPGTVVFRLSKPAPPFFLQILAVFSFGIPSPQALDEHGAEFARHPVGSGPFRFVSWSPKTEIVLHRNDDYWDGAPKLKQVIFQPSENPTVRTERLMAGAADVIDNIDPLTIPRITGD